MAQRGTDRLRLRTDWLIQAAVVAVLAAAVAVMTVTAQENLARERLGAGFGFLWMQTGWDVAMSLIAHSATDPYWRTFLIGLLNTLLLSGLCITLAGLAGVAMGFAAVSSNPLLKAVARCYVFVVRNVPQILQLFFWYAVTRQLPPVRQAYSILGVAFLSNRGLNLPSVTLSGGWSWFVAGLALLALLHGGLRRRMVAYKWRARTAVAVFAAGALLLMFWMARDAELGVYPAVAAEVPRLQGLNFSGGLLLPPEFVTLVVALVTYNTAFIAEIVRAGVRAVPWGQVEAARSLGLGSGLTFRKVVLPQALRIMVPPLTNQAVSLAKSTSLAVAIGFTDLFQVATIAINHTGRSFETVFILMVAYAAVTGGVVVLGRAWAAAFRWP